MVVSCAPPTVGPDPQPRHVPWLGIKPATLLVHRPALNSLSHTSQDDKDFETVIIITFQMFKNMEENLSMFKTDIKYVKMT